MIDRNETGLGMGPEVVGKGLFLTNCGEATARPDFASWMISFEDLLSRGARLLLAGFSCWLISLDGSSPLQWG